MTAGGAGLYLHVPFCAHRCHYCDFNTYAGMDDLIPAYVAALRADLRRVAAAGPEAVAPPGAGTGGEWPQFASIFVGGGTPTLLPPEDLAGVLRLVRDVLPLAPDAEITVEANPESVSAEGLATLVGAGANRISMGAQSFAPHVLDFLGRWHDPEAPLRAVEAARSAGVTRVSLDLIYGAPAETDADWERSLDVALAAGTDHVSAYALTVEPNTEYAARIRRGAAPAPDDDVQATRMAVADARLTAAGFARYEVSNWARPGQECRHNLTYWRGGNWLGVGAGAHGHWVGRRWWSLRAPGRYADVALSGASTTSGEEVLTGDQRRTERLWLGLRTVEGVSRAEVEPLDAAEVRRLVCADLLSDAPKRLRPTASGLRVADGLTSRLL
ncbi:MAG: coproporphyrinogen III oxidase [Euzebyales bacterium]|nr:coproporphyrinogen III oxidase [Euzebyales bacterium]MBA3621962.1 coproporphyrinogen III oxidase [Euzebyales bacterium]